MRSPTKLSVEEEKALKRLDHAYFEDPDGTLTATAPYNFVALPETFCAADADVGSHAVYDPQRISGWIDLTITVLTELYIRGTHTPTEYATPDPEAASGRPHPQTKFFQPASQGRLPGSTLRGLTRSLVEILTESRVTDISSDLMFYRTLDGSSLSQKYTKKMVDIKKTAVGNGNAFGSNVCAGYFKKENGQYRLYAAREKPAPNGSQFFRIERHQIQFNVPDTWHREEVWFKPSRPTAHNHAKSSLWYGKINGADCCQRTPGQACPGAGWEEGWLVVSGDIAGTKHLHWIVGPPEATPLHVDNLDEVICEYEREGLTKDVKSRQFSVLPQNNGESLPCFYKMEGKNLLAIGHTGMMRLPYKNTPAALVEDLIPGCKDTPGLAERIFGVSSAEEGAHAGFVYFEDALIATPDKLTTTAVQPKVLGEPHPTTFPHYLCQDKVENERKQNRETKQWYFSTKKNDMTGRMETVVDTKALNHWDSVYENGAVATPRGTKLYWHRRNVNWQEQPGVHTDSHAAPIMPASKEAVFCGRVRFDNLTEVQLGALLSALQLPEGHAHKVGMGKPYGLGSVRIACRLHRVARVISDDKDGSSRYEALFDADGHAWHTGESDETTQIADYQAVFARWMGGGQTTPEQFWQMPRMRELEVMLRFDNSLPPGKTEYLQGPGDETTESRRGLFYLRRVLPGPLQVAGETPNPPPPIKPSTPPAAPSAQTAKSPSAEGKPSQTAGAAMGGQNQGTAKPPPTTLTNVAAPMVAAPGQEYKRGDKVAVKVLPRTGNTGPLQLPNGEIVEGQNTAAYQPGQTVNLWVEQTEGNRVVRLTKNRVTP